MKFNIFPHKGDKKNEVISKILILLFSLIFLISIFSLVYIFYIRPIINDKKMTQLDGDTFNLNSPVDYSDELKMQKVRDLKSINDDIKGWIYIPNTYIDYPVLQAPLETHDYYLYRDYNKESTSYGSIFIDSHCDLNSNIKHIIVHGHHMRDGRMFANLVNYSDINFYKSSPIVYFYTPDECSQWKIISIYKTNTLPEHGEIFNYLVTKFKDNSSFLNYIYNIRLRSLINTSVDVTDDDTIMTLSTCSYEYKNFRTVVVARKTREGEDTSVDVNSATVNPNPLYPDIWYETRWGKKIEVTSFEQALSEGKIDWYKPATNN